MGIYKHDKTNACFERESGKGAIPCFPSGIHLAVPASSLRMNQSIRSTADALLFKQLPTCTLVDPAMPIPNKNAESSRQNRFRRGIPTGMRSLPSCLTDNEFKFPGYISLQILFLIWRFHPGYISHCLSVQQRSIRLFCVWAQNNRTFFMIPDLHSSKHTLR